MIMLICNLHSVTSEHNCVTSSINIRITSAGCPAEQPTIWSSEDDELSTDRKVVEAHSGIMPEPKGSQSL